MKIPNQAYFPLINDSTRLSVVVKIIRNELSEYILNNKLQSLVLGISGGIDSALCTVLLAPVCRNCNIPLIGRSITIETNTKDEIARSIRIGNAFCHDFAHLDLTSTFYENKKKLIYFDDSKLSKLRQGNLKARMRMMILYDLAQLYHGIVISTDNYTEYLTGFWTLHGDVGDYAPIINLWKTEVYNLSRYILHECNVKQKNAVQNCIDAVPVDGLGISSCDCEQLQVKDYYEADKIFQAYFSGEEKYAEHPLIKRFISSDYKRNIPIEILRERFVNLCNYFCSC